MQTLIKWPGGKTSECSIINEYIPPYDRYIEPFFGGGAVFFNLPPQHAVINDISENLIAFYRFIQTGNAAFREWLYEINDEWERMKQAATPKTARLCEMFLRYRENEQLKDQLITRTQEYCAELAAELSHDSRVIANETFLRQELCRTAQDKVLRTRKNEIKNKKNLSERDLTANILTGFTSGYYMYLRNELNRMEKNSDGIVAAEYKIAVFYFVREFCYGSMFRYNRSGEFNIPYGGIAYNGKDFKKKIDALFSEHTQEYFANTQIVCGDFENVLNAAGAGDFVFLDPPYDTDFSDYENRRFGETEQRRLAQRLRETSAKFLLIIKNTPLINELYRNGDYKIHAYDSKYSYCVKRRNDRNAVHLIITNY